MISQGLNRRKVRSSIIAYLFISPALIIFTVIMVVPTFHTFYLSLTAWDGVNPVKVFIGLENYVKAFIDQDLHRAFINNLTWVIFYVSTPTVIGLLLAVGITKKGVTGRDKLQAAYFLPYVLSPVVVALIWIWVYSARVGILSGLLQALHIVQKPYGILGDMKLALYGLIVTHVWTTYGFCTVIYVAGLQNVEQSLYEAATLDGANALQRFWYVTLPGISSVTTFLILLSVINSFKVFNQVFLMTLGGPVRSTEVLAFYMYRESFVLNHVGYGSAIAIFLTIVILAFGIFFITSRERKMV